MVTAQKRSENLQDVPISIQALNTEKLEQLSIVNIDDYVKYLSGVTTVKGTWAGRHRHRYHAHVHARRGQRAGR